MDKLTPQDKELKIGDVVCFQHEGYYNGQALFTKNVYDYYTRKIIAKWKIKKINHGKG